MSSALSVRSHRGHVNTSGACAYPFSACGAVSCTMFPLTREAPWSAVSGGTAPQSLPCSNIGTPAFEASSILRNAIGDAFPCCAEVVSSLEPPQMYAQLRIWLRLGSGWNALIRGWHPLAALWVVQRPVVRSVGVGKPGRLTPPRAWRRACGRAGACAGERPSPEDGRRHPRSRQTPHHAAGQQRHQVCCAASAPAAPRAGCTTQWPAPAQHQMHLRHLYGESSRASRLRQLG